jgi:hypothetical protein
MLRYLNGSVFIASFVAHDVNSDNGNQSPGQLRGWLGFSYRFEHKDVPEEQSGTSSTDVSVDGTNVLALYLLMPGRSCEFYTLNK